LEKHNYFIHFGDFLLTLYLQAAEVGADQETVEVGADQETVEVGDPPVTTAGIGASPTPGK